MTKNGFFLMVTYINGSVGRRNCAGSREVEAAALGAGVFLCSFTGLPSDQPCRSERDFALVKNYFQRSTAVL